MLIDALAVIMGHEEKELCKPGHLALVIILETATSICTTKERACQLPMFDYLAERMCALCYERAWYAKLGGCSAIKFLFERMSLKWVLEQQFMFLKALLFVMMDLTAEVCDRSSGISLSSFRSRTCLTFKTLGYEFCHKRVEFHMNPKKSFYKKC